jgi:hypothetical protein
MAIGSMAALSLGLVAAPLHVQARPSSSGSVGAPAVASAVDDEVQLNEIQVVGSHNSYHLIPSQAEVDLRRSFIGDAEDALQYRHVPLPEQFGSQKVRQIELDVFLDPAGGKYANPLLRLAAGVGPYDAAMNEPGIKVLHVQDVDYETTFRSPSWWSSRTARCRSAGSRSWCRIRGTPRPWTPSTPRSAT